MIQGRKEFPASERSNRRFVNRPFLSGSRLLIGALLLLVLLLAQPATAAAQGLDFSVPELKMEVYVQPDASARIIYDITFANSPVGGTIDIVDIATSHDGYDLNNMSATLNGSPVKDIRVSEFIDTGVEIHLGDHAIAPGDHATLHFELTMPDLVFQDTTRGDYASFQIMPTPFEPGFLQGTSDIWIAVHMLPGIALDELLYQDVQFSDKIIFNDHSVAAWRWPQEDLNDLQAVGVSFPRRGMSRVIEQSFLELAEKWLVDNPSTHFLLGMLTIVFFIITYFRFTWGTGISVFVVLTAGLIWILYTVPLLVLLALPVMILLFALNERRLYTQKHHYLPAIAQVEGGGIKRGLTAPEAAVLLELPLNKILTLLLFGLLEKGICQQQQDTPLIVTISPEYTVNEVPSKLQRAERLKIAQDLGVVIRSYEHAFLKQIEENTDIPVKDIDFAEPMKNLISNTVRRMKGFDLSDTQEYYRKIITRAMKEARSIGEIPEREQYLDRHLQWLLMDDDYPTVFSARRYHYRPVWVRPFASSDRLGGSFSRVMGSPNAPGGKTSFSDVTASFAGWTENTMGNLASSIAPGAIRMDGPAGRINLSGADKVTKDVFKALTTSSGGGRSGGGGCACACAGCACACACAGGGR
ncbi:MAG TPA: hypothetical protein VMZ24_03665 [Patescibacteria group bacterium]|nr:hypothetical protein [Patescibacteria group bacterium]